MRLTKTLLAATAFSLVVAACSQNTTTSTIAQQEIPGGNIVANEYSLQRFDACVDFLDYVKTNAKAMVGPYGLGYGWGYGFADDFAVAESAPSADGAASTATRTNAYAQSTFKSEPDAEFSTTNVQEKGVDEPDIVKTDGKRLLVLTNGELQIVDVTGRTPDVRGSLRLNDLYVQDMLFSGDTALLIASGGGGAYPIASDVAFSPIGGGYSNTLWIIEVDVSDSDNPTVTRQLQMDGRYVSARMIDDTVRLVVNSSPVGLQFVQPEGSGLRAERQATEANKQIIDNSTIENWVPYYVLETVSDTGRATVDKQGALLACDEANAPANFAGLDMISIVTIDMSNGLDIENATGVLSSGETVYASTDALYIATTRWVDWQAITETDAIAEVVNESTTDIHKFDISDPKAVTYRGSGSVKGYMLSQWSMSEYNGDLRVASTSQPDWRFEQESESFVTVLTERDGELKRIGEVGGLGKGERIFSVRFMGDVGYVVTFRQTDPLYTLDLSDPTDPTVVGELKIPGYSAYLHPISDDLLIGVGQDATDEGQILGMQVSLFDVSDLANPKRIDKYTIKGGNSEAEWDHRAFLYWEPRDLVVLPLNTWWWDEGSEEEQGFTGAIGLEVTENGIKEIRRIVQSDNKKDNPWDWQAQVRRTVVIGDSVYTISEQGLLQSTLDTLEKESFTLWYR